MKIRVTLPGEYPLYRDCETIVEAYECLKCIIRLLTPSELEAETAQEKAMMQLVKMANEGLLKHKNAWYELQKIEDEA